MQHIFSVKPARQTNATTNFADVTDTTISNTSLTAGKKYLNHTRRGIGTTIEEETTLTMTDNDCAGEPEEDDEDNG